MEGPSRASGAALIAWESPVLHSRYWRVVKAGAPPWRSLRGDAGLADEAATIITVTFDGDEWRVMAEDLPIGGFPNRALAYEVAMNFAELAARGGGRAEILCE